MNPLREAGCFSFETARLLIRPLSPADEALYCALYSNPLTMRFIGPPLSSGRALRSFRAALRRNRQAPLRDLLLTLVLRDSGRAVGLASVQSIDPSQRKAEAGVMIDAAAQGKRLSIEALQAVIGRAFDVLPVDEVRVEFARQHAIARRSAMSIGFEPESVATSAERWVARRSVWRRVGISAHE